MKEMELKSIGMVMHTERGFVIRIDEAYNKGLEGNEASVRVLDKSGFLREGLIRQGKMVSTWCDYYIYGIIK